jgi:hypothetical protein
MFLGKFVYIPAKADEEAGTDEAIEDDGDDIQAKTSAPPPPPPPPGSNLAATWAKLVTEVQAAIAANPARKDGFTRAAAGIPDLIKANNVEEATAKMDALRAMLTAPPPPPPPPANLTSRWNELVKDLQAAVAANPARKDALARAAAGIPDLIKANNVQEATARMEALEALLAAPPPPPPPPANLTARWNQMVQDLRAAVAANPARKDALSKAAAGIPDLIKGNKTAEAKQRMDALEAMLGAAPPPASGASPLTARWNALVKRMQAEVAAHPEKTAELTRARAGIHEMIQAGKLDVAARLMDGVERALGQADPRAAEYHTRYGALEKELLEALKDPARDASSLRAIGGFANEKAEAGDYAAALQALDRLQAALGAKTGAGQATRQQEFEAEEQREAGAPYKGIVRYRKSLLDFDKAKKTVASQLDALLKAMAAHSPDLEDLADAMSQQLGELNDEIDDVIDVAMSASENEASPVTDAIRMKIQKYIVELSSNPKVKHADENPFGVKVAIEKTLTEALENIRKFMPVKA